MAIDYKRIAIATLNGGIMGAGASLLFATNSWTGALLLSKGTIITCAATGAALGAVSGIMEPEIVKIVRESSRQIIENTKPKGLCDAGADAKAQAKKEAREILLDAGMPQEAIDRMFLAFSS
jgi:hypothetical protein